MWPKSFQTKLPSGLLPGVYYHFLAVAPTRSKTVDYEFLVSEFGLLVLDVEVLRHLEVDAVS